MMRKCDSFSEVKVLQRLSFVFCLIISLGYFNFSYSQVTFKEIEIKKKLVDSPLPYDSLSDFQWNLSRVYYKQYIGLQIFLPPISNPDSSYDYHEEHALPFRLYKIDSSACNLSTLNIYKRYYYRNDYLDVGCSDAKEVGNRYYTILDVLDKCFDNDDGIIFLIRDDISKDSLYFVASTQGGVFISPFILVPYFVKQKELYEGKRLVYSWPSDYVWDFEDCKRSKIIMGSKWKCEVTLLKMNSGCNTRKNDYSIFYILTNDANDTIVLDKLTYDIKYNNYQLIPESEYVAKEKEKYLAQKEIIAKNQNKVDSALKQQEIFKKRCIEMFGEEKGSLIAKGKVSLGMTTMMCKTSWGKPWDTYKTSTTNATYERWMYGWRKTLYFENEILVRIDE